jgi:hypothetical protein
MTTKPPLDFRSNVIKLNLMSFKEICDQLPRLNIEELREIERISHELMSTAFDHALDLGAQTGKFDSLRQEAEESIRQGKIEQWP